MVPPAGRMKPAAHRGLATELQSTISPAGTGASPQVAAVKVIGLPFVMSVAEAVTSKQPVTDVPVPVGPLKLAALWPHVNVTVCCVPRGLKASTGEALTTQSAWVVAAAPSETHPSVESGSGADGVGVSATPPRTDVANTPGDPGAATECASADNIRPGSKRPTRMILRMRRGAVDRGR